MMRQRSRGRSNWAVVALWLLVVQFSAALSAGDDGQRVLVVSHDQQASFVPAFLRFGDNAISANVETTRQTLHIEIDRFALTVRPGS